MFIRIIGGPDRRRDIARLACVSSDNGRVYPLLMLATYSNRFEGRPVYVHHSNQRSIEGPGLLGWVTGVTFSRADSSLIGMIEPVAGREEALVSDRAGWGWGVSWEGTYTKIPRRGIEVVTAIVEVRSIDLTPAPAAGGAFLTESNYLKLRGI